MWYVQLCLCKKGEDERERQEEEAGEVRYEGKGEGCVVVLCVKSLDGRI